MEKTGSLLVMCENALDVDRRVRAIVKHLGLTHEEASALPICIVNEAPRLFSPEGKVTPGEKKIVEMANGMAAKTGIKCGYVVIDNMRRTIAPGDLNKDHEAGIYMNAVLRIRDKTGATVNMIHHSKKSDKSFTGSGAILSNCDSMWMYAASKPKPVEITFEEKLRLGDKFQKLQFSKTTECVAVNSKGKPIETVVVIDALADRKDGWR